jgi:hypothetical protein
MEKESLVDGRWSLAKTLSRRSSAPSIVLDKVIFTNFADPLALFKG